MKTSFCEGRESEGANGLSCSALNALKLYRTVHVVIVAVYKRDGWTDGPYMSRICLSGVPSVQL